MEMMMALAALQYDVGLCIV